MTEAKDTPAMPMRATRSGASRQLLTRKARETATVPTGEPLEASFPPRSDGAPETLSATQSTLSHEPTAGPTQQPAAPGAWSTEDEAGFQTLLAKRKAAGYQRRGKNLAGQVLKPGAIKPNPNTIVATILALVDERSELSRCELLDLMASTSFPHPKARPSDKGWCQGYVAGAVRNGFLAVASEPSATARQEG
jgi:hypothetical protein